MGQLDQFAKQIFAEEAESVTHGGAVWVMPPEIGLSDVRLDGLLVVRDAARLSALAAPWSAAEGKSGEIVLEIKMPGDHLDMPVVRRALLRRQAREVQRAEDKKAPWDGEEPLWVVAPHVPAELRQRRGLQTVAPGCHRVDTGVGAFSFLWIAANELPLADELIPFLVARSGRALDEFALWVRHRRPPDWVWRMVQRLPMSKAARALFTPTLLPTDEPELIARQEEAVELLVDHLPNVQKKYVEKGLDEGRLLEARSALRRVLARRGLALRAEDDARIDACTDLATLERWLDQAIDAASAAEALR